jgi:putative tricarboxylic transport membrane protein
MLIARGDFSVFVTRPISAVFVAMCVILVGTQIYVRLRSSKDAKKSGSGHTDASPPIAPQMAPQRIPVTPAE